MSYIDLTLSQFLGVSKIVMDTLDIQGFDSESDDFNSVRIRIHTTFVNGNVHVDISKN